MAGRPESAWPHSAGVVRRSEHFASSSGEPFWRSLSVVLMDAAPVSATRKRSDRPCRGWIESDVKGGLYNNFQVRDPISRAAIALPSPLYQQPGCSSHAAVQRARRAATRGEAAGPWRAGRCQLASSLGLRLLALLNGVCLKCLQQTRFMTRVRNRIERALRLFRGQQFLLK